LVCARFERSGSLAEKHLVASPVDAMARGGGGADAAWDGSTFGVSEVSMGVAF